MKVSKMCSCTNVLNKHTTLYSAVKNYKVQKRDPERKLTNIYQKYMYVLKAYAKIPLQIIDKCN